MHLKPACVVTRAAAKRACASQEQREETHDTASATGTTSKSDSTTTIQSSQMVREDNPTKHCPSMKREQLIHEQRCDAELTQLAREAVSEEEMTKHDRAVFNNGAEM